MICSAPQVQTWIVDHDPIPVVTLDDPVIEAVGFAPESRYAETTGSEEIFELSQSVVTELARPQKSGVQHS